MTASVRQFKAGLSRYLKRAAAGEKVIVTSRGRPIAQVTAAVMQTEKEPSAAEIRRRLSLIPGVILGKPGKPKGGWRPTRVRKGQKSIAEIVLEDRR